MINIKDVMITIKGVQRVDDEVNETEIITEGTLDIVSDGYELRYNESDATGYDGANTLLRVSDLKFQLERTGSVTSELIIELGKKNFCHYGTPYGDLIVGVQAKFVESWLDDNGGRASAGYVMDVNSVLMGDYEIYLEVKPK